MCPDARGEGGEGKECGDSEGHTAGDSIGVKPEGDPGYDDDEDGGNVGLQDMVAILTPQVKGHLEGTEVT